MGTIVKWHPRATIGWWSVKQIVWPLNSCVNVLEEWSAPPKPVLYYDQFNKIHVIFEIQKELTTTKTPIQMAIIWWWQLYYLAYHLKHHKNKSRRWDMCRAPCYFYSANFNNSNSTTSVYVHNANPQLYDLYSIFISKPWNRIQNAFIKVPHRKCKQITNTLFRSSLKKFLFFCFFLFPHFISQ